MDGFDKFKKENKKEIFNKINLTEYHIQKIIEKVRNKQPIILDFFCHGFYDINKYRDTLNDFLLTLAVTGEITTTDMMLEIKNMYVEEFLNNLLYGNLSSIQESVSNYSKKLKNNPILKNTELKLYHGKDAFHFNKEGKKVRKANVEKKSPPLYASFTNRGSHLNKKYFFLEPGGIYFIEDSMKTWHSIYPNYRKMLFRHMKNKDMINTIIHHSDLKKLHKLYGIKKPNKFYTDNTEKGIEKRNNEIMEFYEIENNPLFNHVKNKSFYIPDPDVGYNVSTLTKLISFRIKQELQSRGIKEKPVILYTFLQCKFIVDLPEVLHDLGGKVKARELSDKINKDAIADIHNVFRDYVSPKTSVSRSSKTRIRNKTMKNKQTIRKGTKQTTKQTTKRRTKDIKQSLNKTRKCKGLSKEECDQQINCIYANGNKRKYCRTAKNRK
jgi:hypothetical protein